MTPCDPLTLCENLEPGFRCHPCPIGYIELGETVFSKSLNLGNFTRQKCIDLDECASGLSNCVENTKCINSVGSYKCDCIRGYQMPSESNICRPMEGTCLPNENYCDPNGNCDRTGPNRWRCRCNKGWVGDGFVCGPDTDMDGWPDIQLNCTVYGCKKDNCVNTANADQFDSNNNGVGDACEKMCDSHPCDPRK